MIVRILASGNSVDDLALFEAFGILYMAMCKYYPVPFFYLFERLYNVVLMLPWNFFQFSKYP